MIAGLLVAGASLIGSRALGLKLVGQVDGSQLTAVIAVMLALVTASIIVATRTPRLAFMLSQWSRPVRWLIASFLLAGSSMVVLLFALGATPGISPLLPVGFYALAWIAGFVVPGAPAGLGVREAVLIGTLSALVGNPMAIIAAAAHRLLSAIVDGIAALAGFALLTRVPVADRPEA